MAQRVFTTGQAGTLIGVSYNTVKAWCEEGRIEHYKLPGGASVRIRREALAKFLTENQMPSLETLEADHQDA